MAQHIELTAWILRKKNRSRRAFYIRLLERILTAFYKDKDSFERLLPEYNPKGYAYNFADVRVLDEDVWGGEAGIEIHTNTSGEVTGVFIVA